jgi:hypothetical protein
MSNFAKNAIKTIAILAVSIGIGFGIIYIIAEISTDFRNSSLPFIMWPVLSLVSVVILRRIIGVGGMKKSGGGPWGSPEQARDKVLNSPQFVGRFDRNKGLLDSTARMVENDSTTYQRMWMSQAQTLSIIRFRGELLDQNGTPREYIPVEIKGVDRKWIGNIAEGDRIRVEGKVEEDGILHAKIAFNYSTNSWVGERN